MPNGAFLSATYEYTGTLCLIPADTNGGTVIRFEVLKEVGIGQDLTAQLLLGQI